MMNNLAFLGVKRTVAIAGLSLLLTGCVGGVGPDYVPPDQPRLEKFSAPAISKSFVTDSPTSSWWTDLRDPVLDELITRAKSANKDVAVATANLRAARAVERSEKSGFFPTIDAGATYVRTRGSAAAQGLTTRLDDVDVFDGAFDATWEVDVFGRVNRTVQAAKADAQAAEARLADVLVSVIAETARSYVELRGTQERLSVARRNIENQRRSYDLTVDLSNGGRGSELDVARAKAQLETTLAATAALEAAKASAQYRLAVLTGAIPGQVDAILMNAGSIPTIPKTIAIGDPGALLRRRPDVRAAERDIAAATARIGVATADLFPRVSLRGVVGLSALNASSLIDAAAFQYSVGPSIVWNFLDAGRIRARIQQADALAEARLNRYDAAVLTALEDAENALTRFSWERGRLEHLTAAASASSQAADLAEQRYSAGVDNFLTVLDAQRSLLASEDALVQSHVAVATQFIAIQKSLGIGWQQ